ncbi:MAG: hypothetical protein KAH23_01680 [Kiritimatiellae bacterium]|nr:hypothetical protein [Kiritimatiellia bacterium]
MSYTLSMNKYNSAVSQYEDLKFNSAINLDGLILVANSDGLHAIGGNDDNGENIEAFIKFPTMDFLGSEQKRMRTAHVDYLSDGEVDVALSFDEEELVSQIIPSTENKPRNGKINGNRDQVGRNISVVIKNVDGAFMRLFSMEMFLVKLSRRTR